MAFLRSLASTALLMAAALVAGCSGEIIPAFGGTTWTYTEPAAAPLAKIQVLFHADGSVTETVTGRSPMTGTVSVSGLSWSASSGLLDISGTPTCTGGFEGARFPLFESLSTFCSWTAFVPDDSLDPNEPPPSRPALLNVAGSGCAYALSSDGDRLNLDNCSMSLLTPTDTRSTTQLSLVLQRDP
jgi:hypothetical protein